MTFQTNLRKVGTLGGQVTFAGEAAARIRQHYSGIGPLFYFKSVDELWRGLDVGVVDAIVIGIERTGRSHDGARIAKGDYVVEGQLTLPIACNLYVKAGAKREDIKKITGHGSIHQCAQYLDENFPGVLREQHPLNSVVAAEQVAAGDGTVAVIGTLSLMSEVPHLQVLAERVDNWALSSWWLISRGEARSVYGSSLIVRARLAPDGSLGALVGDLQSAGGSLRTVANFACDEGVSTYDYLLSLSNPRGEIADILPIIARYAGAKLIGAFEQYSELA